VLLFIRAPFFNSHDALLHWRNLSLEFLHSRYYLLSVALGCMSSVMKLSGDGGFVCGGGTEV